MVVPNTPVVNAGLLYVNGLRLSNLAIPSVPVSPFISGKALLLEPGQARDSTNSNDLILPQALDSAGNPYVLNGMPVGAVINGIRVGANGLDTGEMLPNSLYAVYVIGSSTSLQSTSNQLAGGPSPNPLGPATVPAPVNPFPVAGLLSLDASQPILPAGYDMYRRVGWATTDAVLAPGTLFRTMWQYGEGQERFYYYDVAVDVLVAGAAVAFTAVPLAVGVGADAGLVAVPPLATQVLLDVEFTPAAAPASSDYLPFGSVATRGIVRFGCGSAAGVEQEGSVLVPSRLNGSVPSILYKLDSGVVTLEVTGFQDVLT